MPFFHATTNLYIHSSANRKTFHFSSHKVAMGIRPPLAGYPRIAGLKIQSPLFVTSKNDIHLQQPESGPDDSVRPIIALYDPLKQTIKLDPSSHFPRPKFALPAQDRMTMHVVIPELGVLVVGSMSGRIAVFALLVTRQWAARPRGTYFVRMDWLLPLGEEEREGKRPEKRLLGLAAGPVQGHLGREERRRKWRLMCYYEGHDVLSYELGLPEE